MIKEKYPGASYISAIDAFIKGRNAKINKLKARVVELENKVASYEDAYCKTATKDIGPRLAAKEINTLCRIFGTKEIDMELIGRALSRERRAIVSRAINDEFVFDRIERWLHLIGREFQKDQLCTNVSRTISNYEDHAYYDLHGYGHA